MRKRALTSLSESEPTPGLELELESTMSLGAGTANADGVGGELDSEIRCGLNSAGGEQVGEGEAGGQRDIEYEIHPDMVGQAFAALLPIGADLRITVFHSGDPATAMDEYAQGKRESSGMRRRRRRRSGGRSLLPRR